MENKISWDNYFMSMAFLASMKSKDRSSRIGSIIVAPENEIISTGFNGMCRGVNDDIEARHERPIKYHFFAHSERNSLYAAAKKGISTDGCRMYTMGTPCTGCCVGIIQAGIKEVIVSGLWENRPATSENRQRWKDEAEISKEMFKEAGVKLRIYDGPLISEIIGLSNGETIKLNTKLDKIDPNQPMFKFGDDI